MERENHHVAARGSSEAQRGDEGTRLDVFVAHRAGVSRNRAQHAISEGMVLVDGLTARKNHAISASERISWEIPAPEAGDIEPQPIPLDIVFEDESLVVIDKPPGMVMYPGPGHPESTVVNALLARYPDIAGAGGTGRPGVFHRLDRDTSGLVAVARTNDAYLAMVESIRQRGVERRYIALVCGDVNGERGVIDAPIGRSGRNRKHMAVSRAGGRKAVTRFEVKERFPEGFTLVEVVLETGRTHQIRVHFSYIGNPVAGDAEYGGRRRGNEIGLARQFLHAFLLSFTHPVTGERLELLSTLSPDLEAALEELRSRR